MDSFIFKGISSTDFNGIVVNSLPPISKPPKRVNKIQIDGRDGDITEFLGYDSYEKEIEITVLKETNIDELIKWLNGKGTLVLSNEPDKCYEAEIINQIDFSRLEKYEKNKIKFHCQPFKHLLNETELKKENLSKTTSGTSIDLNDSTEMRCELKISGNSEQETRSGKNLIRNENKDVGDNSYWYLYSTYDKETYTMTRSTTATTESFIAYRIGNGIIKNNTQYTISFEAKKNEYVKSFEVLLIGYNTTGIKTKTIGITNEFQKYSYTFTTDATADYKTLSQIRFDNNGSTENGKEAILTIRNVMLVEGTDTDFEQYGVSPSPDYPSPIKTVGSNINLIEETFEGYNINGNGAFEKANGFDMQIAKLKANVKYTLNSNTYVFGYYNEKPTIASITYDKSRVVLPQSLNTITPTRDGYISFRTDKTDNNKKIKLVEGTEVGEYSPYGQGCISEVICNKNFANVDVEQGAIGGNEGIDYASTKANNNTRIRTKDLIKLDTSKRYTINFNKKYNVVIQAFNSNKLLYSSTDGIANVWHTNSFNFSGYPYVAVAIRNNDNTSNITPSEIEKVKLSLSETDKTQTYTIPTQQPFRAIKNIRDTFIKKNNKWYERHYGSRYIITGTENIILEDIGRFGISFKQSDRKPKIPSSNTSLIGNMSNYYKESTPSLTYKKEQGFCFDMAYYLRIYDNTYSPNKDLEGFKTRLSEQYNAGTPVYVDYVLETPLDIECTEEQSKILEELNNARTYKNVTHIYSTDKISSYKEVTYYLDNRLTITNAGNTESKPVIKIYGKDDIYMYLNDIQVLKIELGNEEYITIDTEKMEAYKDTLDVLKNRLVTGNYDNILLKQGQNILYFEGKVSKVEVSNYSRWT